MRSWRAPGAPSRPGVDADHAEDHLDDGGLARPVGADETGDHAGGHDHVEGPQGEGALASYDVVEPDGGRGRRTTHSFVAVHRCAVLS